MSGRRDEVLAALRAGESPLSIAAIAEQLEIHPNTARFHLDALVASGRVETVEPKRIKPGRPAVLFKPVPGMDPVGRRDYRMLAGILADSLASQPNSAASAAAAGQVWAKKHSGTLTSLDAHRAVDKLTELLADLGFTPEKRAPKGNVEEIGLRSCPFLELAVDRRDVVCPIHLGLMQGAMSTWNATVAVESLTPFVEPDLCLARLVLTERSS